MSGDNGAPAFERAAATYDAEARANPAMVYMRAVSLATLKRAFGPGQRLLEIGCGTGEEAVALARLGCCVLATDVSPAMLALTEARAAGAGVASQVQTLLLSAAELSRLSAGSLFDGAYSSFGPLNALADLEPFVQTLAGLVRPGGRVVLSVMNRCYPLEVCWLLAHGQVRQAFRRWSTARASVSRAVVQQMCTHYHSLAALRRAARPWFRVQSSRALPLLLPPPYLAGVWQRHPWLVASLQPCEARLATRWPWAALGDHWLVELERLAASARRQFG